MSSTELATTYDADVQALIEAQDEELAASTSAVAPIIKLTQALTSEVKAGDAEAGEFFNTLTSESYGPSIEFIVSVYQEGRALSGKGGAYATAIDQETIPQSWADRNLVGEEVVGTRFDEHPDAYEQYSARANSGEIEWGSGPPIATTFVYTGHVVTTDPETNEQVLLPGRLTLQRSTKEAHKKIVNLKTSLLRGKAFWDIVFDLEAEEKTSGRNDYFGIKVKKGRNTTQEEKLRAVELALSVKRGEVTDNADRDGGEAPVAKPDFEEQSGDGISI